MCIEELFYFKVENVKIENCSRFSIPCLNHQTKGNLLPGNQEEIETENGSYEEARKDPLVQRYVTGN